MATKSFTDNPALRFISTAGKEEREQPEEKKEQPDYQKNPLFVETRTKRTQLIMQPGLYDKVKSKAKQEGTSVNEWMHRAFETAIEDGGQPAGTVKKAPPGYKLNPLYAGENRTKKVQLLIQPGLYAKIKETAEAGGISVNEWMHRVLEKATKEECER